MEKIVNQKIAAAMLALTLFACGGASDATTNGDQSGTIERGDNGVAQVEATDAEVNAAKAKARSELPMFMAKLKKPGADEVDFSVKFNLTPDADPEFIWAGSLREKGGVLSGELMNDPLASGFAFGQRVTIAEKHIIDWSYRKADIAQGHYTTRAIIAKMPPDEAAAVKNYLGWK
jgi:uncharacterized protein YegJ (DUF2314 family)